MAKTNRPLKVLVHPSLLGDLAIKDLNSKMNEVFTMDQTTAPTDFDLVIGPNCWRIIPGMEDQISHAIKAARAQRYGRKETENG